MPEVTPLYAVVRDELETYLARAHERELRAYLECGLLCHDFECVSPVDDFTGPPSD